MVEAQEQQLQPSFFALCKRGEAEGRKNGQGKKEDRSEGMCNPAPLLCPAILGNVFSLAQIGRALSALIGGLSVLGLGKLKERS